MSHALHSDEPIEEIDLSNDPEARLPRLQNPQFDVELYVLNHQQSLKNNTTVWHRDADGSFRAVEWTSRFMYRQDRKLYLDRDGHVNHEWAEEKWRQWSQRDFHSAVEAYVEYNEASAEMTVLKKVNDSLHRGDDAFENIKAELVCAKKTLEFAVLPPNSRDPDHLPAAMNEVLKDLTGYLHTIQTTQQEAKEQIKSLELAVKSLLKSKTIAERSKKRREAEDEKMIDTVKFLKECLDNHCRLVNVFLGKPEPLVQQGTDLIQAILSEMFGLPLPVVQDTAEELETEAELESESEVGVIWEKFEAEDFVDTEAMECSGTESDVTDSEATSNRTDESEEDVEIFWRRIKYGKTTDPEDSEYHDCSETESDASDNDLVTRPTKRAWSSAKKRKITLQDEGKKARDTLYKPLGPSIVSDTPEAQDEAIEADDDTSMTDSIVESPMKKHTSCLGIPVMRQTQLNFNKVQKSRRMLFHADSSQNDTSDNNEEAKMKDANDAITESEAEVDVVQSNPKRRKIMAAKQNDYTKQSDTKTLGTRDQSKKQTKPALAPKKKSKRMLRREMLEERLERERSLSRPYRAEEWTGHLKELNKEIRESDRRTFGL